jgi:tetratricopeptide (TPR) repeat protein
VLFLALVYLAATMFSIVPRLSLWGSYQRLQGLYSTLSYLVIFFTLAANLRRRAQVERLVTTIILASLPVSLYGILQRYQLDPIPWGGDVSRRIASSLGNSIFIAAYLIMVFPLTLGRMIESFRSILKQNDHLLVHTTRATLYIFIAAIQLIAIYMSGSRGPVLGLMAAVFFIALLLALLWRKRWFTYALIGSLLLLGGFLLVFNLEGGPLETLRTSPAIGRFGLLLNAESNSALVRRYIWEGVTRLIAPHAPLEYPDGRKDALNAIRPLVGYGPESMFVANSPFYNPALGQVERRNAAPDRSHNETWDSLVNAGVLGLIAYLWLFTSVFYFGLKWLGLIGTARRRSLFFALYVASGAAGGVVFVLWRGIEYFGVGLPFGLLLGLMAFVILVALQESRQVGSSDNPASNESRLAQFLLSGVLLAALLAHFVEINFGIAIGVTRTYFWVYTALLLLVGYLLPQRGIYGESQVSSATPHDLKPDNGSLLTSLDRRASTLKPSGATPGKKKRRAEDGVVKKLRQETGDQPESWFTDGMIAMMLTGIILATLGFALISNPTGEKSTLLVLWKSLTNLRDHVSYGILGMLLIVWVLSSALFTAEAIHRKELKAEKTSDNGWKMFLLTLSGALMVGVVFWLWSSAALATIARNQPASMVEMMAQIARYENMVTGYALYLFLLLVILGYFLPGRALAQQPAGRPRSLVAAPILLLVFGFLALNTNLKIIQADIVFKLAGTLNQPGAYPAAIAIYQRANQLAPNEDYYYLFLGRAYLDQARTLTDPEEQANLLNQAARDLQNAQALNPLNTDHTANLARLFSLWATIAPDRAVREEKINLSDSYFSRAVVLSPNSVRLWNEWAYLALILQNQPQQAQERLERALEIDPSFDWTYGQLGDLALYQAESTTDGNQQTELITRAISLYDQSLALPGEAQLKFNYGIKLGSLQSQLGNLAGAINAYLGALQVYPQGANAWRIQEILAELYAQAGDRVSALEYANQALNQAPQDQQSRIQTLIQQLQSQPR